MDAVKGILMGQWIINSFLITVLLVKLIFQQ